jgi:hypothetical protein
MLTGSIKKQLIAWFAMEVDEEDILQQYGFFRSSL